jgi:hypothetical protein
VRWQGVSPDGGVRLLGEGRGKVLPVPLNLKKVLVEIAILHYNVKTEEKH